MLVWARLFTRSIEMMIVVYPSAWGVCLCLKHSCAFPFRLSARVCICGVALGRVRGARAADSAVFTVQL